MAALIGTGGILAGEVKNLTCANNVGLQLGIAKLVALTSSSLSGLCVKNEHAIHSRGGRTCSKPCIDANASIR